MRIAIFTQPLGRNYGGILQNYALQQTLKDMGHYVKTVMLDPDDYKSYNIQPSPIVMLMRIMKRVVCKAIGKETYPLLYEYTGIVKRSRILTLYTKPFVNNNIHVYIARRHELTVEKDEFDCLLVGSDQVWRPLYNCDQLYRMFFDFAEGWKVKRIAFSASFGVDEWEYTEEETRECARLAKQFDAISVREDSGINLCRNYLGVDAIHTLDPTLLLDKDDYISLIKDKLENNKGRLVCYVLDRAPIKTSIIETIAKDREIGTFTICADDWVKDKTMTVSIPSIETWLNMFNTGDFVFTDSFHGTVFSIIFNKPFVVFGNEDRGMARFKSLLSIFGLEDRLISSIEDYHKIKDKPIDWERVNRIREEKREQSLSFLTKALS